MASAAASDDDDGRSTVWIRVGIVAGFGTISAMGYTTVFAGRFRLSRPLARAERRYLIAFSNTRRMKRDAAQAALLEDPVRTDVGLPIGPEGAYFVGGAGFAGQDMDASIVDCNEPPQGQPGLWCQWQPDDAADAITWNGREKFYDYHEWIAYLITHFLQPWGHVLNGTVAWQGEEADDVGRIVINDNVVTRRGRGAASALCRAMARLWRRHHRE